ncbi:MAG TPA: DUF2911 domain-containing protein [Chthoniobacterales bacterium]|nr:DUF2911 domain-containing protein [Chthoniobacterales bacterium]
MKYLSRSFLVLCLSLIGVSLSIAQDKPRVSPHETINADIDGSAVTIVYGRPYSKDPKTGAPRKIWGELVQFGKVWRTGADEATLLTTKQPLDIGGTTIPAGTYSLFTLPEANGAKLVVNKQTGQWGTKYDEKQDLARIDMKKETADKPVDQFTIAIDKNPAGGGTLKLTWEDTQYSVALKAKK